LIIYLLAHSLWIRFVEGLLEHDESIVPELKVANLPFFHQQGPTTDGCSVDEFIVQISSLLSPKPDNGFLVIRWEEKGKRSKCHINESWWE
jgi:hypothetical protein